MGIARRLRTVPFGLPGPDRFLVARRDVAAPPEVVWDLLVDTEAWPLWGPTVAAVDCPDRRIHAGSRGRVRPPVGPWVSFEVTSFVPGESWAWRVAGVPATAHHVRARPGGSEVALEVPWWAPAYVSVCALAARRIARLAEAR
ncbi:MAG TPA: SRPBCC family protein [Acidimicrobiales bacterium]|nr:SRPBCC family protein [Acidimicrobiales bacterium]